MSTVIIDFAAGNLHSAEKAFQRMAREADAGSVVVSSDPKTVAGAERIVLPGDGAFPACAGELRGNQALYEALTEAVENRGIPFLGICVGMQLMARQGHEYTPTNGLGWIDGEVVKIDPNQAGLKIPHMGWNDLVIDHPHPVLSGLNTGDHAYFVHSYHMVMSNDAQRLAHCAYGGDVTAIVGRGNMIGTQFHPEKSQQAGLRLISNFLTWSP